MPRARFGPWLLWGVLAAVAAALSLQDVMSSLSAGSAEVDRALALYSLAPRIAVALLAGAALGLSGALRVGAPADLIVVDLDAPWV
ncbi:hypothetical protein ACIKT0_18905, partial [Hansschlegelia beijingensis]